MRKLETICAISLLSAAAFVLTGCPEESASKGGDRTEAARSADAKGDTKGDKKDEAAADDKDGATKTAKGDAEGDKKDEPAVDDKDGEKSDEKSDEKK